MRSINVILLKWGFRAFPSAYSSLKESTPTHKYFLFPFCLWGKNTFSFLLMPTFTWIPLPKGDSLKGVNRSCSTDFVCLLYPNCLGLLSNVFLLHIFWDIPPLKKGALDLFNLIKGFIAQRQPFNMLEYWNNCCLDFHTSRKIYRHSKYSKRIGSWSNYIRTLSAPQGIYIFSNSKWAF